MSVAIAYPQPDAPSIAEFGREIFRKIGAAQPSAFDKRFWSTKMMEWSMTRPGFKTNLFRLVDVLPSLRTQKAVAEHISRYLAAEAREIHPLLGWALTMSPGTPWSWAASFVVHQSVKQMAAQFIAGESPSEALQPLRRIRAKGLAFTIDLLGEFCVSEPEAEAYLDRYLDALEIFGREMPRWRESRAIIEGHPGELSPICISVKMTALYSQCNILNFERSVARLAERLATITRKARDVGAIVYVDAEDSGNNPLIYEAFKRVFGSQEFVNFPYPGIVIQAYAKSSEQLVDDMIAFARTRGSPLSIRLVKGAYWDSETYLSQQNGWPSPLFSQKESSDAQYELLSRKLIDNHPIVMPAFGSHNIRSLSHACCYASARGLSPQNFELQMLFGMADPIAEAFASSGYLVRLYAPLGEMLPGMGYLVRRLLENTSNESFLRHTFFESDETEHLLREPQFRE